MKKFIFAFVAMFVAVVANAQSFQYHAGYDTKSEKGYQKFIADYYWTSADEKWNVFSWNSFDVNLDKATPGSTAATALLYVEYKLGETDFYLHPEVRFNTADANYYQIGFAYRLPLKNVSVYLTPKYSYHKKSDFQFSINTSYENNLVYYEGYFDTDWGNKVQVTPDAKKYAVFYFTEQKFYGKLTDRFQLGVNLLFGGNTHDGLTVFAPMASVRVSLY